MGCQAEVRYTLHPFLCCDADERTITLRMYVRRYLCVAIPLCALMVLGCTSMLYAQDAAPLTLRAVVHQVLTTHPLTEAAAARVQAALGLVRQAGAYANPEFSFAHNEFARERTAGLKQVFEWPFKRSYRIGVALADEKITESEQETVRQDLIAAAREAFFHVLVALENVRVAESFAATTEQLQQSTSKRWQEGDIPEFEVTKARVETLKAVKDREVARGQLTTAQAGLNLLLGRGEAEPVSLDGSLRSAPSVPPLAELYIAADTQNPLLVAQRQAVTRERLNVALARASRIPDLAIDLTRGEELKTGVVGPLVGLSFAFPLWDRKEGAIAAAVGKLTEAEAMVRATRLQVRQALLTAYRNWETAQRQVDIFTSGLLVQAEEAATLAERSYQEGESDLLGVLDAQRSLLTVRREYAQALFEQHVAWVAVERAAGIATGD